MMTDVVAIQNNNNNNSEALAILNKVENQQLTEWIGLGHQQFINSQLIFLDKNEAIFQDSMQHFHRIIFFNCGLILFLHLHSHTFFIINPNKKLKILFTQKPKSYSLRNKT